MYRASANRLFVRCLSNAARDSGEAHIVYKASRRAHAIGVSALAGTQAGFWAYSAYLSQQVAEPLLGVQWTVAGLGLSAAFAGMIHAYLKRSVTEVALVGRNLTALRVTTHAFGGGTSTPVEISVENIVPGAKKDDPSERYWSFGAKRQNKTSAFYYIIDTKKGVQDPEALGAIARGGQHLMVLTHQRRADEMRKRWKNWEENKQSSQAG